MDRNRDFQDIRPFGEIGYSEGSLCQWGGFLPKKEFFFLFLGFGFLVDSNNNNSLFPSYLQPVPLFVIFRGTVSVVSTKYIKGYQMTTTLRYPFFFNTYTSEPNGTKRSFGVWRYNILPNYWWVLIVARQEWRRNISLCKSNSTVSVTLRKVRLERNLGG